MVNSPIRERVWCAALLAACVGCSGDDFEKHGEGVSEDAGDRDSGGDGGAGNGGSGGSNAGASSAGGRRAAGGAGKGGSGLGGAGGGAAAGGRTSAGGAGVSEWGAPDKPVATACTVQTAATPPSSEWKNVTGDLAGLSSECGNLTMMATDPCSNQVIAGVARQGLWATTDGGVSWSQLGAGQGSASITHRPSSIVFDPERQGTFYESGIYGTFNDGVYRTTDGGETFEQLGDIGHNDLVSVDFHDPERKTLLAGSHETKQRLYLSRDGGETFTDIGAKLPADSHFSSAPLVLDADHFLLGACGWGDGTCGVYLSADGGETWNSASTEGPSGRPLWASDGTLYFTTIWDSGIIVSDDAGASWSKFGGPRSGYPVELPDGRVVTVGGEYLIASSDGGHSWSNIGEKLPYAPSGVTYSAATKTFFVWRNDCGNAVLSDAVMSAGLNE